MWLQKLANNEELSKALIFGDMGGAQIKLKNISSLKSNYKKVYINPGTYMKLP